jgi:poly(A) polymerase
MNTEAVQDMAGICSSLAAGAYSAKLRGFNAIDKYLGLPGLPCLWVETNADIAALARLFENLRFPGVEIADGAVDTPGGTCYFLCPDDDKSGYSFPVLSFSYDLRTRRFQDPLGVYPLLRTFLQKALRESRNRKEPSVGGGSPAASLWESSPDLNPDSNIDRYRVIMDASLLLARYGSGEEETGSFPAELTGIPGNYPPGLPPGPESQRAFLSCLLVSPRPDRGLSFLKHSGFLEKVWPELACFDEVDHSKEFHPEGNVWNHTLETFRYRKAGANGAYDFRLSLGLLLHDAGKPVSAANGARRFNGHAELGAWAASRLLERLEFEPSLVADVYYLVRNHMLPAALKRLPVKKTAEIMSSPLFPTLMELYRCDESSSFKGLDGYYENSAAYQAFLRNTRNPYRSADGKKIGKYV